MSAHRRVVLALMTALLLFTAAIRLHYLISFVEWPDEIYTVWQASLNLHEGLIHSDPFWPPLFGILVWGWMHLAGSTLEVSRFVSVLLALLAVALVYRAARAFSRYTGVDRITGDTAGLLAALSFAVMAYSIFTGVDVRAYGLVLMLLPLVLWLTVRWLRNPRWRNAALVSVAIAALLHAGFSSLILIPFLTLFVLAMRPRLFVRWATIGIGVLLLALPIAPQFLQNNVAGRLNAMHVALPPLGEALIGLFRDFGGSDLFLLLLAIAALLIVVRMIRNRQAYRQHLLLLAWVLFPALIYFTVQDRNFWHPRYLWWVATGLALLMGYAFARLPRLALAATAALLMFLPMLPTDFGAYRLAETTSPPFRTVFSWLAEHIRSEDVLVIDPNCTCGEPDGWDLFVPQYFPTGLPIVDRPGQASRVWYLSTTGWKRDETLLAEVEKNRKPSIFVGPWYFLLRLYEGPPSWQGVGFGDKIRLNGAEIENPVPIVAEGESLTVKLWWSAQQPLTRDYSISLALLDSSARLVAQSDGPAHAPDTPAQTSQWQPGSYYEDLRSLHIPSNAEPGNYALVITVYQWWDGVRLTPQDNNLWQRIGPERSYLQLATVQIPGPF